jgi:hypothetical protein
MKPHIRYSRSTAQWVCEGNCRLAFATSPSAAFREWVFLETWARYGGVPIEKVSEHVPAMWRRLEATGWRCDQPIELEQRLRAGRAASLLAQSLRALDIAMR